jgi:hypothetical protein
MRLPSDVVASSAVGSHSHYTLSMSSRVRRCGGCGGPLSEPANSQGTITCSFCGTVNEVTTPASQPIVIRLDSGAGRRIIRPGGGVAFAIGVTIFAIIVGVGAVVYRTAVRPASSALGVLSREALRARELTRPLALTELPTLNERGHRQVNVPEPPGGWKAFDPVAGLPWAFEIAQAWAPDARLTRIDLGLISGDGVADLTGDRHDTIGYRFVSPSRIAQWAKIADTDVNASAVAYELFVRLGRGMAVVYVHNGRPPNDPPPPALEGLPLRDLLARARESKRFPAHPFYTGFLLYSDRMGWVWLFSSLSRREDIPRVRARDAAVYPWR